jgi:uncharacterized protein (DUF2141 family)
VGSGAAWLRGHGSEARRTARRGRRILGPGVASVFFGLIGLWGLGGLGLPSATPAELRGELRVKVTGLRSDAGALRWGLFDKKETFATKDGPIRKGVRPLKNGQCEFTIPDLAYGTYALIVGHDVNGDGQIDQNPFSAELKGISNYTAKILWFPDFNKAKFRFDPGHASVEIRVY